MSLTMTDTEVSTKLLAIFEALISSCSQQYQLLCEEDQLKANKIFSHGFFDLRIGLQVFVPGIQQILRTVSNLHLLT